MPIHREIPVAVNNKERILGAASELLLAQGLNGLSVRAISQRAGLSTIAIYSHFQGKQGVLDALYVEGFGLVRQAVLSVAAMEDPIEAALASGQKYLDIAHHNEGHYRLIFGETGAAYTPSDHAAGAAREAFEALVAAVARLLPAETSESHQQRAALRVWATLHGYVSLRHHVIGRVLAYAQWREMAIEALRLVILQMVSAAEPQ